jgi:SAM-dependent methyltransferase
MTKTPLLTGVKALARWPRIIADMADSAHHLNWEMSVSNNVSGTEGYAENAPLLIKQWRRVSFAEHHRSVLHLIPANPSRVLDIGAGIGTDAAAFAAMGHSVVAVEPVDQLRNAGMELHSSPRIEWVDDSLPDLLLLRSRKKPFELAMLTAVWMHLDEQERRRSMANVCALLSDGATLIMSLRHGPVPAGRRMFDVSAEETIELANTHGLQPVLNLKTESVQSENRRIGVTWIRLAFVKGPEAG